MLSIIAAGLFFLISGFASVKLAIAVLSLRQWQDTPAFTVFPVAFLCWHTINSIIALILIRLGAFTSMNLLAGACAVYVVLLYTVRQVRVGRFALNQFSREEQMLCWALIGIVATSIGIAFFFERHNPPVTWYYLNQAQDMLAAGKLPAGDFNFGRWADYEIDKLLTTTQLAYLVGLAEWSDQPFLPISLFQIISISSFVFALSALLLIVNRSPRHVFTTVCLAIALPFTTAKLSGVRGDSLGLCLLLSAMCVTEYVTASWRSSIIGVFLISLVSLTHPVSGMVFGLWWGIRWCSRFHPRQYLFLLGQLSLVMVIQAAFAYGFGTHLLAVQRDIFTLSDGPLGGDSTSLLRRLFRGREEAALLSEDTAMSLWSFAWLHLTRSMGIGLSSWFLAVRTALIILVALGSTRTLLRMRTLSDRIQKFAYALLCLTVVLALAATFLLLTAGSDVLRSHLLRREMPYLTLLWVVPASFAFGGEFWRRFIPSLGLAWAVFTVVAIHLHLPQITIDGERALRYIAKHSHKDDTIIANGLSSGIIQYWTPAKGLLEGRAPYFQHQLLRHTITSIRQGQRYFTAPPGESTLAPDWIILGADEMGMRAFAKPPIPELARHQPIKIFGDVQLFKNLKKDAG